LRNISFFLTRDQILARIKRVTRRVGWSHAIPGMMLQPIYKGQGLKAGESVERLGCPIIVKDNRPERLTELIRRPTYGEEEAALEGFPEWSGRQFVDFLCKQPGVYPERELNRILFDYAPQKSPGG